MLFFTFIPIGNANCNTLDHNDHFQENKNLHTHKLNIILEYLKKLRSTLNSHNENMHDMV